MENPWLSAMSSHFAYWGSPDVALFILRALYHHDVRLGPSKEAGPQQPTPASAASGRVQAEGPPTPETPTSPLSPVHSPGQDPGFLQMSADSKASKDSVPKGLSDPEDWW